MLAEPTAMWLGFFLLCCGLNGLGLRLTDSRPVTQPKLDLGLRRGWSGGAGAEGRAALNKWMKHSGCQRSRERWVWLDVWCVRLPVRTKWRKCQLHWIDGREAVHPHLHRCNIKKSPRVSQEETLHSSSVWRAEEVQSSWSAEEKGKVLPPLINNRRNIFFFSVVSAAARRVEARGHFHSQPILLYLENVPVKSEKNKKKRKKNKNKKRKKKKKRKWWEPRWRKRRGGHCNEEDFSVGCHQENRVKNCFISTQTVHTNGAFPTCGKPPRSIKVDPEFDLAYHGTSSDSFIWRLRLDCWTLGHRGTSPTYGNGHWKAIFSCLIQLWLFQGRLKGCSYVVIH